MNASKTRFLTTILEEPTITAAAEKAKISRATAYRFLKDSEFQEELTKKKSEAVDSCVRYLQGKLAMCSQKLIGIIENPHTANQVKINAIALVYQQCKAMTEAAELLQIAPKVDQLNAWIENQKGNDF